MVNGSVNQRAVTDCFLSGALTSQSFAVWLPLDGTGADEAVEEKDDAMTALLLKLQDNRSRRTVGSKLPETFPTAGRRSSTSDRRPYFCVVVSRA